MDSVKIKQKKQTIIKKNVCTITLLGKTGSFYILGEDKKFLGIKAKKIKKDGTLGDKVYTLFWWDLENGEYKLVINNKPLTKIILSNPYNCNNHTKVKENSEYDVYTKILDM